MKPNYIAAVVIGRNIKITAVENVTLLLLAMLLYIYIFGQMVWQPGPFASCTYTSIWSSKFPHCEINSVLRLKLFPLHVCHVSVARNFLKTPRAVMLCTAQSTVNSKSIYVQTHHDCPCWEQKYINKRWEGMKRDTKREPAEDMQTMRHWLQHRHTRAKLLLLQLIQKH